MVGILIFLLGCAFALLAYQKMYLLAIMIAIVSFILIIGIEKLLRDSANKELIIQKLCYAYVIVDIHLDPKSTAAKAVKRTLKEIAVDIYGPGHYSLWLKWQSKFVDDFNTLQERMNQK